MARNSNKNKNVITPGNPSDAAGTAVIDARAQFTAAVEAMKLERTTHLATIAEQQGKIDGIDAFFRENGLPVEGAVEMQTVTPARRGRKPGSKNAVKTGGQGRQPNADSGPQKLLAVLKRRKNGMEVGEAHTLIGGDNPNSATAYLKRTGQIKQIIPEGAKRGGRFVLATK